MISNKILASEILRSSHGSVLGPPLFFLYINDLPEVKYCLQTLIRLFEDDAILYRPIMCIRLPNAARPTDQSGRLG